MSTANNTHLVRGLNKASTRMIRVELVAQNSADAMRQVRLAYPDAGPLSVRIPPHAERVLEQLAQMPPAEELKPWN